MSKKKKKNIPKENDIKEDKVKKDNNKEDYKKSHLNNKVKNNKKENKTSLDEKETDIKKDKNKKSLDKEKSKEKSSKKELVSSKENISKEETKLDKKEDKKSLNKEEIKDSKKELTPSKKDVSKGEPKSDKENKKSLDKEESQEKEKVKTSTESLESPEKEEPKVKPVVFIPEVPKKEKKRKTKSKIILILIIIIILMILFAIGLILVKNFILDDFEANISTNDSLNTKDSYISFKASISTNRPILNIYYAVDPEDKDNKELFQKIDSSGSLLNKEVEVDKISIPVGKREICFYVETFLGVHSTSCLEAKYDIGYISSFEEDDIITIDSENDIKVVSNEILVLFKDDISEKEAKKIIEDNGGEVIGALYFANLYQVKVSGSSKSALSSTIYKFGELDEVSSANYNIVFEGKSSTEESTTDIVNPSGDSSSKKYENTKEYKEKELNEDIKSGNTANLNIINATAATELMEGKGQKINVGVIDSVINYNHSDLNLDLKNVYYNGTSDYPTYRSLIDETSKLGITKSDTNAIAFHGSNVASIAFAKKNNNLGINGINDNVNLYFASAYYFYNDVRKDYNFSFFLVLYNISTLAMSDCKVINMSINYTNDEKIAEDLFIDTAELVDSVFEAIAAAGKNFLLVQSSGNGNSEGIGKDASEYAQWTNFFSKTKYAKKHLITVGAINSYNNEKTVIKDEKEYETIYSIADFSNYGDGVDIFAPGTNIWGLCATTNTYCLLQGTSQAAPHVAGVASLIYSLYPDMSAEDVKKILVNSSTTYTSNHGSLGKVLDAEAAVNMALNLNGDYAPVEDAHYGFLQGTIKNADTDEYIKSASVYLTDKTDGTEDYTSSFEDGVYDFAVKPGTYDMHVVSDGYVDEYIYNIEVTEGIVTYNVSLKMASNNSETGIAKGSIIDAFDGKHIPEATMKIYRGINNSGEGDPVTTITSDSSGNYEVTLDPGNYTAIVTKDDYLQSKTTITVVSSKTKSNQNCSLTPILKEGEIRAILTWGSTPSDLDSHLVGPTPDGNKFHIFYSNKNYNYSGTLYDNLDLDDTSSYGPETTSVYIGVSGTYTYYVHDFSNRGSSNSSSLANSNAQVKLYIWNKEEPIVYNVPNLEGTLWKVFSITNGEIIVHNEMSYVSNPSAVGNN